ncbi:hypothetical protein CHLNCDRAFT_144708 [Chlorella variabilis]|uniref:Uncharacterized protein n=1 Tax=Chlorella variabilis TaxID=554065 RepID=E1ZCV0_CHLVA|nr:hypothetical protein CHLNCDRAFT_144708 [Chlorella variabilis]EFN56110.1 hypothetical protein CHLNCDRAFT_144708 [Chlorella variabilis]|eukprot:XP_005848212.1 hypothetical protein CHLNCDRAFT_144708 [Chlorella variabilis]
MPLTHACALLLLLLAAWETAGAREGDAAERPDRGAREGASSGASSGSGGGLLRAPRQLRQARRGGVGLGQPPPVVVLYTQFGAIRVKLLEGVAPRITALVWHLAAARNCSTTYTCAFYRNEARPQSGPGPPYALLQGRMHDLAEASWAASLRSPAASCAVVDPPWEGVIEVKRGHVCFIPGGKDFFIALGDHPEWGKSHPCWGLVEEWFATDLIIAQAYNPWTHPDHGTVLRILTIEVPYTMAVEGDRTYGGMLGSLR